MEFGDFVRRGATINRNNSDNIIMFLRKIWEGLGAQRCGSHHSDDVEVLPGISISKPPFSYGALDSCRPVSVTQYLFRS